jgi:DNA-directed RNA polymerase specialized sigma24 family protein
MSVNQGAFDWRCRPWAKRKPRHSSEPAPVDGRVRETWSQVSQTAGNLPHTSVQATSQVDEIADAVGDLIAEKVLERMVRSLDASFPNLGTAADDAVATAVERLLRRSSKRPVANVAGWLYVVARNEMASVARRASQETMYDENVVGARDGFEDGVVSEDVVRRLRAWVTSWDNRNIRAVTLVLIDAAVDGERLTRDELVDLASAAVGEELSSGSVGTWRKRGLERIERKFDLNLELDIDEEH